MQGELIRFGSGLVYECGRRLAEKRRYEKLHIVEKNGYSDIVTDHDIWVQKYLFDHISKRYPSHRFIGEETLPETRPDGGEEKEWSWVADPIDGTSNYSCLGRNYAISVALMKREEIIYGWVYDVTGGILYEGGYEEKDFWIGYADREYRKEESLLYMGHKTMKDLAAAGENPWELCDEFRGVRYEGCASLEICRLAETGSGAYLNSHLKLWDFAGAASVLASRGYTIRAARNGQETYFVCACGSREVYSVCEKYFPKSVKERMQPVIGRTERKAGMKKYAEGGSAQ